MRKTALKLTAAIILLLLLGANFRWRINVVTTAVRTYLPDAVPWYGCCIATDPDPSSSLFLTQQSAFFNTSPAGVTLTLLHPGWKGLFPRCLFGFFNDYFKLDDLQPFWLASRYFKLRHYSVYRWNGNIEQQ